MSNIYFCFSDENGDYQRDMSKRSLKRHPFYIRTTLIMNAAEWKKLNKNFQQLKDSYELPREREVKWAYTWRVKQLRNIGKDIPSNDEISFLKDYDYIKLIKFVAEALNLIKDLEEKKIIATFTKNDSVPKINEKELLKMHLQEHMQRIEMELQSDKGNLGVLFFDPVSSKKNEMMRDIYNELYTNGDFIKDYSHIKDSLNIENSHQSVGIQIADFISGSFSAILKSNMGDYSLGIKMFNDFIKPNLRRHNGNLFGYGIREVPRNHSVRKWIIEIIS